jgi:hypothetical protein
MQRLLPIAIAAILGTAASANPIPSNPVLAKMTAEDQAARSGAYKHIDWDKLSVEDAARRARVLDFVRQGTIRTAEDYCNAAMIFQHGDTVDETRLAWSFATTSRALDPADRRYRWLSAAAWDRIMMRLNRPQWYGTQFTKSPSGQWELYTIDETAATDADRADLDVPPLATSRAMAATIK